MVLIGCTSNKAGSESMFVLVGESTLYQCWYSSVLKAVPFDPRRRRPVSTRQLEYTLSSPGHIHWVRNYSPTTSMFFLNSGGQSARFCRDSGMILVVILARFCSRIKPESCGHSDHPVLQHDSGTIHLDPDYKKKLPRLQLSV